MYKQDIMSTGIPALALLEARCEALEEKIKEQDKALAKIADLIGLEERSQPFQIIERVRFIMYCAEVKAAEGDGRSFIGDTIKLLMGKEDFGIVLRYNDHSSVCAIKNDNINCRAGDEEERIHGFLYHVLQIGITEGMRRSKSEFDRDLGEVATAKELKRVCDRYMDHISETFGLPSGSTWASVSRRVSEVQSMWKEALAQANRDADEILHLKAKAKEWEAASRNARQQGFDEAVAIVEKCIEAEEECIEEAVARVADLKNMASVMRNAVLCDDE